MRHGVLNQIARNHPRCVRDGPLSERSTVAVPISRLTELWRLLLEARWRMVVMIVHLSCSGFRKLVYSYIW